MLWLVSSNIQHIVFIFFKKVYYGFSMPHFYCSIRLIQNICCFIYRLSMNIHTHYYFYPALFVTQAYFLAQFLFKINVFVYQFVCFFFQCCIFGNSITDNVFTTRSLNFICLISDSLNSLREKFTDKEGLSVFFTSGI